ncbi:MAG TPA: ATP-grasp domain-containing protein [Streptosporangiaceae bacterium]|nr:ATP-grasp domain-containing protein [Streptosporangiaceae bacterium]
MSGTGHVVAIVDPFSTGAHLQAEFAARGWPSVAVLSTPGIPGIFGALQHADRYLEVITGPDTEQVVAALRRFPVSAAIPGCETGVPFADELAERLGLPGNGTARSASRRDKQAMAKALVRHGVRAPQTIAAADPESMVRWADERDLWPIVVKPPASAGSDGVTFCATPAEARAAFGRLHRRSHRYGGRNDVVLAQELLAGQQFMVNTVSVNGDHYVAEIWEDTRRPVGGGVAYELEKLVTPGVEPQEALARYVSQVLDALGIAWGPAHSEVMLTDSGPVLIETGARTQGAFLLDSVRAATGHNHVTLTVDCYTDPGRLAALIGRPYPVRRQLWVVALIAPYDGHLATDGAVAELYGLPTLHDVIGDLSPGRPVSRTVDLNTAPAGLYLIADDAAELHRDYARIRHLEANGLYVSAAPG